MGMSHLLNKIEAVASPLKSMTAPSHVLLTMFTVPDKESFLWRGAHIKSESDWLLL